MTAQRKYPDELRERAVRMVLEIRQQEGKGRGELARVGRQRGVHPGRRLARERGLSGQEPARRTAATPA